LRKSIQARPTGLGFDAEVSRRFNLLKRRGLPNYIRAGLAAYRSHQAEQVTVTCEGRSVSLSAFLVAVTNSDQYGNNARLAPGARVDDGRLDLIAVRPTGLFNASLLAVRLFAGGFDRHPAIVRHSSAHFVIERALPGLFHTDGETHQGDARLEVVVNPRHLRITVPATRAHCSPVTRACSEKLPAKELA
jgi:diacylglycerol kinase family enzyme